MKHQRGNLKLNSVTKNFHEFYVILKEKTKLITKINMRSQNSIKF